MLDRAVAESADPAGHARFLREGRSAARFAHPNAVATFDAGEDGDTLFIVMEQVEGTSLAHVIADEAPMADGRVVDIGTQLLSALGAAHEAGIIHRDVKPANILIDRAGGVKLADFGIARRFDEITSSLTVEGMVVGTRGYLAPEQARGSETGPAVDLYAVGAVLFEMATGARVPDGSGSESGFDPRTIRPDVSADLAPRSSPRPCLGRRTGSTRRPRWRLLSSVTPSRRPNCPSPTAGRHRRRRCRPLPRPG